MILDDQYIHVGLTIDNLSLIAGSSPGAFLTSSNPSTSSYQQLVFIL